jgi:hypothetical protein
LQGHFLVNQPSRPRASSHQNQDRAVPGKHDLSMPQSHHAGEKLFVYYAGQTMPVIDPRTGKIHSAQIYAAMLRASNYTYAKPPGRNL